MPDYRLYDFKDGHIVQVRVIDAEDDAAAAEKARLLAGDKPVELWCGKRKVLTLNRAP